jgi:hypothetical protein
MGVNILDFLSPAYPMSFSSGGAGGGGGAGSGVDILNFLSPAYPFTFSSDGPIGPTDPSGPAISPTPPRWFPGLARRPMRR